MKVRAILQRGAILSLLWWVLAQGRADSWGLGLISVALALIASLWLSPPSQDRFSITGLLRFAGFFLFQSAKAGVQVAIMALRPRLDLAPALLELPITLPAGPARVLLINTLSLLPGTLSVGLNQNLLRLHVLDARLPIEAEVRAAEALIARLLKTDT